MSANTMRRPIMSPAIPPLDKPEDLPEELTHSGQVRVSFNAPIQGAVVDVVQTRARAWTLFAGSTAQREQLPTAAQVLQDENREHVLVSWIKPLQSVPPLTGAGFVQDRVRFWLETTSQLPCQDDHVVNPPATHTQTPFSEVASVQGLPPLRGLGIVHVLVLTRVTPAGQPKQLPLTSLQDVHSEMPPSTGILQAIRLQPSVWVVILPHLPATGQDRILPRTPPPQRETEQADHRVHGRHTLQSSTVQDDVSVTELTPLAWQGKPPFAGGGLLQLRVRTRVPTSQV